jgi:hypothetical protein
VSVFVNSGIGAQIIMTPESPYGVAPDLSSAQPYEFNSETLELKKTIVQGKGLHAGGLHNRGARRVLTNYAVVGGITMDLPTRYLNQLLWQMFGSKAQAAAVLTEDATTGAYSATHAPGTLLGQSMAIQKGVPSVDGTAANPFTYTGMKLTDWAISVATGAIASLVTTWDGRNELGGNATHGDLLNASVPALGTFTEAANNNVFHFREATLYTGGTVSTAGGITSVTGNQALGNVKSAEVKYAFKLDNSRYFLGSKGFKAEQLENDYRDVTGQFVIEWLNSEAQYEAFAADTPTCLELTFVGDGIGTGTDHAGLTILIPQIFLEGDSPKVGGPAVVTQTVPFTGLDDSTNNPIQATYWTLDAA